MPPRVKITKKDIIDKAIEMVRAKGIECINARDLASALGCSTQPIFSNFESINQLCEEIIREADRLYVEFSEREMQSGKYPPYKASGMAYIRFAKEESQLFKLLFMRDRSSENPSDENAFLDKIMGIVRNNTGLDMDTAKLFHLEMWAFGHGIASMIVTGYFDVDMELVSKMMSDAYLGIKRHYEEVSI